MKTKITQSLRRIPTDNTNEIEFESFRREDTESGYNENVISIFKKSDGALFFSEHGEGYIYLYPEQVKHLRKVLRMKHDYVLGKST